MGGRLICHWPAKPQASNDAPDLAGETQSPASFFWVHVSPFLELHVNRKDNCEKIEMFFSIACCPSSGKD